MFQDCPVLFWTQYSSILNGIAVAKFNFLDFKVVYLNKPHIQISRTAITN